MAAGLGFKTFNTGDVLSATDVNGYLMQGVLVFADSTARSSAITSPQEGQYSYLKDTNSTEYYTGSAWVAVGGGGMTNPMTTTGDTIYSSSGSTPARLGIGSTGQVLTVSGGVPSWATPAGSSGPAFRAFRGTSDQSISNSTWTKVELNSETFDTASAFDSTTNYRFTPQTAGYYQINGQIKGYQSSYDRRIELAIYKNGSEIGLGSSNTGSNEDAIPTISDLIYFNGSSDYVELYAWIQGTSAVVRFGTSITFFGGVWIRS